MQAVDNKDIGELDICAALYRRFGDQSAITAPRYTPPDWWECDFFRITKAGYFFEYEIKFSMADYRRDFKKTNTIHDYDPETKTYDRRTERKHDLIGTPRGPNRFCFVVPETMRVRLPAYAGIMKFDITPLDNGRNRIDLRMVKAPPLLHRVKIKDLAKVHQQVNRSLAYRYWNFLLER